MNKECVLDIGIGTGGSYIQNDYLHDIQRVGIDTDELKLKALRHIYPEVVSIKTDALCLPFKNNSFSKIDIILPAGTLISYLQTDSKIKNEHSAQVDQDIYQEFSRVLKPKSELLILIDHLLHPNIILKSAKKYFTKQEAKILPIAEFEKLGTLFSENILQTRLNWSKQQQNYWQSRLIKIRLKNIKAE